MRRSKILIFFLMFALIALFALGLNVNVKATSPIEGSTASDLSVIGAKLRTAGTAGIRFVGEVDAAYNQEGYKFGIALAFGEANVEDIKVNGTVNGKSVLTGVTESVDENNRFYVNLINIPENMYGQKITTRSYVIDAEENVIYADTVTTRSLGEVVLKAKAAGELDESNELINGIYNYVEANYKKVFVDQQGQLHIDTPIYETNAVNLGKAFIADWNAKFETSLDNSAFTGGASSKFYLSAKTGSQTDWSNSKLKEFFQDSKMYAKWGWLLDFIITELTNGTGHGFAKSQAEAIINNVEDTANWYFGAHLCSFIMSTLTGEYQSSGWGSYSYQKNPTKLGLIVNYNNTVLADLNNSELVLKGEYTLPTVDDINGYQANGWTDGTNTYTNNYTVTEENVLLTKSYTANEYTITYYYGETELTDLAYDYTIEDSVTLPTYELEGYTFEGWYDNPEFSGNAITEISKGTTGDKVFYAKMVENTNVEVNVILDLNGGFLGLYPNVDAAIADFLADYNTARGTTHTAESFYNLGSMGEIGGASLFLYNVNYKTKWTWLVNYIAGVASSANKVAFTTFFDYTSQAELNAANSNNIYRIAYELRGWVGQAQYTKNSNFKTADYSTAAVKAAYVAAVTLPNTYEYSDPCALPTPLRANYTFIGWKSSVDGEIVTEFPGYTTNPGDITYTAQWESNFSETNITFDNNGGALYKYPSVDAAITDFLADYNTARGKTHTVESFYNLGEWGEISDASLFLYNVNYKAKWTWLVNYIAGVASSANKVAFTTFFDYTSQAELNAADSDNIYRIAYELRGWVGQAQYTKNSNFKTADYSNASVKEAYNTAAMLPNEYIYNEPCSLPTPIRTDYTFMGWRSSLDDQIYTTYPGYDSSVGSIVYTAVWKSKYATVTAGFDVNGGIFNPNNIALNPVNSLIVDSYSNTGLASGTYMCDTGVTKNNGLQWQFYVALSFDKNLDAYKVVLIKSSDISITKACEAAGVSWTHALSNASTDITKNFSVGQYIFVDKDALSTAQTAKIYTESSLSSYSQVYDNKATLPVPVKEGYIFEGWKSSIDGQVYFEIPAYLENPGDILFTAQWRGLPLSATSEVKYNSTSYVAVGDTVSLEVNTLSTSTPVSGIIWSSNDNNIATVNSDGVVTGVSTGYTTIRASLTEENYFDFGITVISEEVSGIIQTVLNAHQSNVFTRYNLGIGAGTTPAYYKDIIGSVSGLMFNNSLTIDTTYANTEINNATADYYTLQSLEFITVHYTGNMSSGADAEANAKYFVGDNSVSIHYTTGNDGVYQALPHNYGGWHAGDSSSVNVAGHFGWTATGVKASANDPKFPVFTISDDFYYEINGNKTTIPMARPWNYLGKDDVYRNTDHILNSDGTISSQSDYTGTAFSKRTPESFINAQGLPFKIVNGEYYMGTTWWAYHQVHEGRICGTGGNYNSIGIESCVDKGSDLWFTWHKTAQLVAKLLNDNNLDITRVRGHHFFDGKDCPQPMLENDLEIWYIFRDMVESELDLLQNYSNYTISMEVLEGNADKVGRVTQSEYAELITYEVTVTNKTTSASETIILYSIIEGSNSK